MNNQWIHLIRGLIAGTFVSASAAYLGSLMITRRMALVGDALGHVALPGMGLALLLHFDPSLGAFAFLALGIILIWMLGERTLLPLETLVGIVFVSSLAIGFLIVPQPDLLESLIGDISRLSQGAMLVCVILSAGIFLLVNRLYSAVMLMNVSPDLAAVEGIHSRRVNFLYLFAIALIVSLGVKFTGSLLVGALVIVPPATARVLSGGMRRYALLSILFGALGGAVGILISAATRFPAGPSIILVSALFFVTAFLFRRRES